MRDATATLAREGARLVAREPAAREAVELVVKDGEAVHIAHASRDLLVAMGEAAKATIVATLDAVSVVEVLTILVAAERTGVLTVKTASGIRQLFLREGRFVGSMSSVVADRLGEVLWRNGRLSLDQVMIAAAQITREKKLGRVLIELGYISSPELRDALREQAKAVVEAACLEDRGMLTYTAEVQSPAPIAFAESTDALLESVLRSLAEVERALRVVGDLDNDVTAAVPPPDERLGEPAQAMLQLVASRRASAFHKRELIERSGLGRKVGLRALEELLVTGYLEEEERTPPVPERPRSERIIEALTLIVDKLAREAPTVLVTIDDWLREPPKNIAPVIAALGFESLHKEALSGLALELSAQQGQADAALMVVVDFALFEATDALSKDDGQALSDQIRALGVL